MNLNSVNKRSHFHGDNGGRHSPKNKPNPSLAEVRLSRKAGSELSQTGRRDVTVCGETSERRRNCATQLQVGEQLATAAPTAATTVCQSVTKDFARRFCQPLPPRGGGTQEKPTAYQFDRLPEILRIPKDRRA